MQPNLKQILTCRTFTSYIVQQSLSDDRYEQSVTFTLFPDAEVTRLLVVRSRSTGQMMLPGCKGTELYSKDPSLHLDHMFRQPQKFTP